MFIGSLLPAVLTAWLPLWRERPLPMQMRPRQAADWQSVRSAPDILPHGFVAIGSETRAAVDAASEYAHSRFVELQVVADPDLLAQTDAQQYQTCLRQLLVEAIDRACSGVLVTAARQSDGGVEIAVLDDGTQVAEQRRVTPVSEKPPVPRGGSLVAEYHAERGTTVLLQLPRPDRLPVVRKTGACDGLLVSTTA